MEKLMEIIRETCKEQGTTFKEIWEEYLKLMNKKFQIINIKAKEREKQIKELSIKLINNFDNKYKVYETKIEKAITEVKNYKEENAKMKNEISDYESDVKILLKNYQDLGQKFIKSKINEYKTSQENRCMKILIMESKDCIYNYKY